MIYTDAIFQHNKLLNSLGNYNFLKTNAPIPFGTVKKKGFGNLRSKYSNVLPYNIENSS